VPMNDGIIDEVIVNKVTFDGKQQGFGFARRHVSIIIAAIAVILVVAVFIVAVGNGREATRKFERQQEQFNGVLQQLSDQQAQIGKLTVANTQLLAQLSAQTCQARKDGVAETVGTFEDVLDAFGAKDTDPRVIAIHERLAARLAGVTCPETTAGAPTP
jgi:hypothetical protein